MVFEGRGGGDAVTTGGHGSDKGVPNLPSGSSHCAVYIHQNSRNLKWIHLIEC